MDRELAIQMATSWKYRQVNVHGLSFTISPDLIVEVFGLLQVGEKITREKHSLAIELHLFKGKKNNLQTFQGRVDRESLPPTWKKAMAVVSNYFTLDCHARALRSYHLAFLNVLRRNKAMNIPLYLFHSL